MGYLLASYYRKTAAANYQRCQRELIDITHKAKLAKKQAEECLKGLEYQAKVAKNDGLVQANARIAEIRASLYEAAGIDPESIDPANLTEDQQRQIAQIEQQINNQTQQIMQEITAHNNQVDIWLENMKQLQYEPLKQEDELLVQEKNSKEEDCQLAKDELEAAKKLVSEEVKNVVPQWGSQS